MRTSELRRLITAARGRLPGWVEVTPLVRAPDLTEITGGEVWLKLENRQVTGAFKLRGAANRLLATSGEGAPEEVVTASTGNHGAAVLTVARRLGIRATVVAPRGITGAKRERLEALGAEVILRGDDCMVAETHARELAAARGLPYVSPYNDPEVIAGQGTIAVELGEQLEPVDAVLVPVGGGGLISGVAAWIDGIWPRTEIVGCQPAASAVMAASVEAGRILPDDSMPTLSDATAGGVEAGSVTFDLCRRLVARWVRVSEATIGAAMEHHHRRHGETVEGAGALPLAALLAEPERYRGRRVVLIVSGGNRGP